ncbi:MAG: hypothetical protein WBJ41_06295 [Chromatiaceae bacterium]
MKKRTRRRFSTAEKLRILDETNACARSELGALLRREKITLQPVNPDFRSIVLTGADAGQLQVVAEFIQLLGGEP